jgi:hypothetical protein
MRKDIPEGVRILMGQYEDPQINAAKTVVKQARLISAMKTIADMKEMGLGTIFFDADSRPEGADQLIDQSSQQFPIEFRQIDGLYTYPEVFKKLKTEMTPANMGKFMTALSQFNATARYVKTVYSPDTQTKNIIGNGFFALMMGHIGPSALARQSIRGARNLWKGLTSVADANREGDKITLKMKESDRDAVFEWWRRRIELGLANQDVELNQIVELANESGLADTLGKAATTKTVRFAKSLDRIARTAYMAGDTLPKLHAFEVEFARHNKIKKYKEGTDEYRALEQLVAEKITDVYPSYDKLPDWVANLRRNPLFGTFVSFHVAMGLSTARYMRLIRRELADPEFRQMGEDRLVNFAATAMAPLMLKAAIEGMMGTGLSDEEEEGMNTLVPPWDRHAMRFNTSVGEDFEYVSQTYVDPHSAFRNSGKAVARYARGDIDDETMVLELVRSLGGPVVQPDFALQILVETLGNRQLGTDRRIYAEGDTLKTKVVKSIINAADTVKPGFVDKAIRIDRGLNERVRSTGEQYQVENEAITFATGHRPTSLRLDAAMQSAGRRYSRIYGELKGLLNREIKDLNDNDLQDTIEAYEYADQQTRNLFFQTRQAYLSAKRLTTDDREITKALIASVGKSRAQQIIAGKYVPIEVTNQTFKDALLGTRTDEQRQRIRERVRAAAASRREAAGR